MNNNEISLSLPKGYVLDIMKCVKHVKMEQQLKLDTMTMQHSAYESMIDSINHYEEIENLLTYFVTGGV